MLRNDLKLALKQSRGGLFRVLLEYALFFNINYGPCGTKRWMEKKHQEATAFLQQFTSESDIFYSYLPFICKEMQIAEPTSPEGRAAILARVPDMASLLTHGPLTKLMRWYSWFECCHFYKNEIWMTKMIMSAAGPEKGMEEQVQLDPSLLAGDLTDMGPILVTPASFMKCQLIKRVGDPMWSIHSNRSKHCTTPEHVQADFVLLGILSSFWLFLRPMVLLHQDLQFFFVLFPH